MTAALSLRAAIPADTRAMAAILSDWIDLTPWMPRLHTREEDRDFITGEVAKGGATVALLDATVAGFSILRDGWLSCLYVAAPARGLGAGSALLGRALAAGPLSLWCFQANEAALAFYLRHGLIETARTDGADNEEHLPDIRLESTALAATRATDIRSSPPPHFSGLKYPGGSPSDAPSVQATMATGGSASPAGRPAKRAETRRTRP